jgi:hypothetical protein
MVCSYSPTGIVDGKAARIPGAGIGKKVTHFTRYRFPGTTRRPHELDRANWIGSNRGIGAWASAQREFATSICLDGVCIVGVLVGNLRNAPPGDRARHTPQTTACL